MSPPRPRFPDPPAPPATCKGRVRTQSGSEGRKGRTATQQSPVPSLLQELTFPAVNPAPIPVPMLVNHMREEVSLEHRMERRRQTCAACRSGRLPSRAHVDIERVRGESQDRGVHHAAIRSPGGSLRGRPSEEVKLILEGEDWGSWAEPVRDRPVIGRGIRLGVDDVGGVVVVQEAARRDRAARELLA